MKFARTALVVLAGALVPLVPTAAHADRYVHTDATADVVSFSDPSATTGTPVPERTEGDIAWTKTRHRSRMVIMTMRYQELTTVDEKIHGYGIRTGQMKRFVYVYSGAGHWGGKAVMTTARGKTVKCRITRKVDYTANTATVWVPRSCLGKPRWVKTAMFDAAFESATSQGMTYIDDGHNASLGDHPAWTPRVYR